MLGEVKEAIQAMDLAQKAASKAGLVYYWVTSARRENGYWVVEVRSLLGSYIVRINALTGEIIEFVPVK